MTGGIPLPRLMDGTPLHPARLSVTLNLRPPARATMLLPPEERLTLRQRVELFTPQGSAGIFRVTAVDDVPGEGCEVTLRHASASLGDALIPGSGEATGSPRAVLAQLLGCQTDWTLGDVELPDSRAITCAYDSSNLLTALLNLLDELPECFLQFDTSATPWTMHLRLLPQDDGCECRLSRNLRSLTIARDDSGLCTRVYVNGLAEPLDAPSIATWGPVSRHLTANRRLGREALTELGRQYLARHSEPTLTVTLDALDLRRATGEAIDSFPPGRLCRVCLPERGEVVRQRVVSVEYPDVFGSPEEAAVTLAERDPDAADYVGGLMANVHVLYRGLADANGLIRLEAERIELLAEDILLRATHEELVETAYGLTTRINEVSVELDAVNAELRLKATQKDVDQSLREASLRLSGAEASIEALARSTDSIAGDLRAATVRIDGLNADVKLKADASAVTALGTRLTSAEVDINGLKGQITLKASAEELTAYGNRLKQAEIDINAATASISLKAAQKTVDALTGRVSAAEATLTVQAGQISSKVSNGDIASTINQTAQSVLIQAEKIDLKGYVTASRLTAELADFQDAWASDLKAASLSAESVVAGHGDFDSLVCGSLYVGSGTAAWQSRSLVTSVTLPTFTATILNYLDHNGNKRSLWIPIRQTEGFVARSTIDYLGR